MPQDAATGRIHLKPTQQRALARLENGGARELTRGEYQELAGVSRSQAAYDLAELVEAGVLRRVGGGRSTRYRLARDSRPGQRRWTSDRIRSELQAFCGGRKSWPSAGEFKEAGRADLYVAASRYGGIGFWAAELGFPRPGGASRPAEAPLRRKFAWAGAGAVASAALVAAAAAAVVLSLPHGSVRTVAPIRIAPGTASDESSHALRHVRAPARRTHARAVRKSVRQSHPRVSRQVQTVRSHPVVSTSTPALVSYHASSPARSSRSSSPPVHTSYKPTPTASSGGPAPLVAPPTASAPNPLKAP